MKQKMNYKQQLLSYRQEGIRKRQQIKAFTLLELLVVISIIAILISMGIVSFSTAQQKARDAKRKSDLKEIQVALEQYYSVCGSQYPALESGFYTAISCQDPNIVVMQTIPTDPRGNSYYCPEPVNNTCTNASYTICAALETEENDFCLTNQQ